jgi:hypothetical protein
VIKVGIISKTEQRKTRRKENERRNTTKRGDGLPITEDYVTKENRKLNFVVKQMSARKMVKCNYLSGCFYSFFMVFLAAINCSSFPLIRVNTPCHTI